MPSQAHSGSAVRACTRWTSIRISSHPPMAASPMPMPRDITARMLVRHSLRSSCVASATSCRRDLRARVPPLHAVEAGLRRRLGHLPLAVHLADPPDVPDQPHECGRLLRVRARMRRRRVAHPEPSADVFDGSDQAHPFLLSGDRLIHRRPLLRTVASVLPRPKPPDRQTRGHHLHPLHSQRRIRGLTAVFLPALCRWPTHVQFRR